MSDTIIKHELEIEALTDNLQSVIDFVEENLELTACSMKIKMQIDIAVEELFVNIAHYAYTPATGKAIITIEIDNDNKEVSITFTDSGIPFNPLEKEDPDVSLSAEERKIGGLGIYMVKKSMDKVRYAYEDGKNKLTITKKV